MKVINERHEMSSPAQQPYVQDRSANSLFSSDFITSSCIVTALVVTGVTVWYFRDYLFYNQCSVSDNLGLNQAIKGPMSNKIETCSLIQDLAEIVLDDKSSSTITSVPRIEAFVAEKNFLGGRTFLQTLDRQCNIVQAYHQSNIAIADQLSAFYKIAEEAISATHEGLSATEIAEQDMISGQFIYDPGLLKDSSIGKCTKSLSYQFNEINLARRPDCRVKMSSRKNVFDWSIDFIDGIHVKNQLNEVSLYLTPEKIRLIRDYGYFDGMEPVDVIAFLSPHSREEVQQAIGSNVEITAQLRSLLFTPTTEGTQKAPIDLLFPIP